ncbi:MAG: hypothetical protein WBN97_04605 [Parvibaculum sp.]
MRALWRAERDCDMALFRASDEAFCVNGQAMAVDGGLSNSLPFAPSRRGA